MHSGYQLIREQWIPKPVDEAFAFFSRPENLERITPPWLGFHIIRADQELHAGSLIEYKLRIRRLPMKWLTKITVWEPPHRFVDLQLKGPYKLWHHEHTFTAENGGTRIGDLVDYALPFGIVGQVVHALIVRRDVETIFRLSSHTRVATPAPDQSSRYPPRVPQMPSGRAADRTYHRGRAETAPTLQSIRR